MLPTSFNERTASDSGSLLRMTVALVRMCQQAGLPEGVHGGFRPMTCFKYVLSFIPCYIPALLAHSGQEILVECSMLNPGKVSVAKRRPPGSRLRFYSDTLWWKPNQSCRWTRCSSCLQSGSLPATKAPEFVGESGG